MPKQKDFFNSTKGFLRSSHLSIFIHKDKHLDDAWDIFWIKSGNDTFTALQMKAFVPKSFKLHAQIKKCHFAVFEKLPKWHFLTCACNLIFFVPNAFIWNDMKVSLPYPMSTCLSMWIKMDKWDNFKKPLMELENSFCFGIEWIHRRPPALN